MPGSLEDKFSFFLSFFFGKQIQSKFWVGQIFSYSASLRPSIRQAACLRIDCKTFLGKNPRDLRQSRGEEQDGGNSEESTPETGPAAVDSQGKLITTRALEPWDLCVLLNLGLQCVVLVTWVHECHAKQFLSLSFVAKNAERLLLREEVVMELLYLSFQFSGGAKPLLTGLVVILPR